MKKILTTLILVFTTSVYAQSFDPGVAEPKLSKGYYDGADKVVFHLTESGDEKFFIRVLNNINNYINALKKDGKKAEPILVLNAGGINLLTKAKEIEFEASAKLPNRINETKKNGLKMAVCYTTLVSNGINFSSLYDTKEEDMVLSGVAEVARLQAKQYHLIKP